MNITRENFPAELKQKNPQAIEYLIEEYGGLLKSVIIRNLGRKKDRWEECFQDCLMAVWNHPERFEEKKGELKNWLCAIAKYKALDLLRREKHFDEALSLEQGICDQVGVSGGFEQADGAEDELKKLLSCLTEEDRILFICRYVKGHPVSQIAEETGIERDLIYTRISRGKKKIRSIFRERGGEYK